MSMQVNDVVQRTAHVSRRGNVDRHMARGTAHAARDRAEQCADLEEIRVIVREHNRHVARSACSVTFSLSTRGRRCAQCAARWRWQSASHRSIQTTRSSTSPALARSAI